MAESDFKILEEEFRTRIKTSAKVDRLFESCRCADGPVHFPAPRTLIWSDILDYRMLHWDEGSGNVGVFRTPANYSNGNTVDREERLLTCESTDCRVRD